MGIAVNLVTYLNGTMHLSSASSANTVTDFMGTSFLLSLLGGFLADSFLGRYRTIAIFATIQTLVSVPNLSLFLYHAPKFPHNILFHGESGNYHVSNIYKIPAAAPTSLLYN